MLIPKSDVSVDISAPDIIKAYFTHPMGYRPLMNMGKPKKVGVMVNGKKVDLKDILVKVNKDGKPLPFAKIEIEYLNKTGKSLHIYFSTLNISSSEIGPGLNILMLLLVISTTVEAVLSDEMVPASTANSGRVVKQSIAS